MASLVDYRNVKILSPEPIEAGGVALNDNFKALADGLFEVTVEEDTHVAASPNILTSGESKKTITNEDTAAINYNTLPAASVGLQYSFVVEDALGIRITANTGDTIRIGAAVTAAGGYIESTTVGASITLTAINNTEWIATSMVEAW